MRKVEGIMIANKNCKTCFGKGYYAVRHDLTHKNTVSCNCLRPLVREGDIDEVVKILSKWVEYYRSALGKLRDVMVVAPHTDNSCIILALESVKDRAREAFQRHTSVEFELIAQEVDHLIKALGREELTVTERAGTYEEGKDQNERVADETDERDSGDH